jgi:tetratricopeptide (TPR) repeat protein
MFVAAALVATTACGGSPAGNVKPPPPADGSLTGRVGVIVATNSASLRAHVTAGPDAGVVVLFVQPGGPADRAGVRVGDVITAVDNKPSTNAELAVVQLRAKPGASRSLSLVRASGGHGSLSVRARLPGRVNLQALYGPLLSDRPNDPVLHYLRASAVDPIAQFSRAIDDLNSALREDPRFVEAMSLRAEIRWQASRLPTTSAKQRVAFASAALKDWVAAAAIDNKNTRALVGIAVAFNDINQTDRALRAANAALRLDDRIPAAHYAVGYADWAKGKNTEAATAARRAIELNPFDVRYYELLGSVFRRLGRVDDCRKTMNSILDLLASAAQRQSLARVCG